MERRTSKKKKTLKEACQAWRSVLSVSERIYFRNNEKKPRAIRESINFGNAHALVFGNTNKPNGEKWFNWRDHFFPWDSDIRHYCVKKCNNAIPWFDDYFSLARTYISESHSNLCKNLRLFFRGNAELLNCKIFFLSRFCFCANNETKTRKYHISICKERILLLKN